MPWENNVCCAENVFLRNRRYKLTNWQINKMAQNWRGDRSTAHDSRVYFFKNAMVSELKYGHWPKLFIKKFFFLFQVEKKIFFYKTWLCLSNRHNVWVSEFRSSIVVYYTTVKLGFKEPKKFLKSKSSLFQTFNQSTI